MTKRVRAARVVLLVASALLAINHIIVIFAVDDGDDVMLAISALVNLLTVLVLLRPFPLGQAWAWWALWPQVLVTASVLLWGNSTTITASYVGIAVLLAALVFASKPPRQSQ